MKKMDWHTIRNFGKVGYFNLSYVVIIGVPLLAEGYKAIYFALNEINLSITLPYTFKVLYLASLFYAMGIAIYQYFCPKIVKQYDTGQDYIDASQEIYERAHPDRKVEIVLSNLLPNQNEVRENITIFIRRIENSKSQRQEKARAQLLAIVDGLYPSCVQRFLVNQYRASLISKKWAIYLSGFLYVSGTLLMVYLLIHKTQVVFSL